MEFARFFARLGTRVSVIQRSGQLLRGTNRDVAEELESALREDGIDIRTGTHLREVPSAEKAKRVRFG